MDKKLVNKLKQREDEGTIRSLSCWEGYVDFHSNDYLGLASVPCLKEVALHASTGSRLISGSSSQSIVCEAFLADFFKVEAALVFNSGYDANLGFFSSIPQKGDTVLYDEEIHASVRDGIRLSYAKSYSFKHNDLVDLERQLANAEETIYVAIESLYSMSGDLSPITEISSLCCEFGAHLIVDEAHAVGVLGKEGKGLVVEFGLENEVFATLVTFGKAYGAHGAAWLSSKDIKKYLMNFARSFIYTTALPPKDYQRIQCMLGYSENEDRRQKLMDNISFFRSQLNDKLLISAPFSPIQMIRIGNVNETKKLAELLLTGNMAVKAIFSPTVSQGKEGIRICIHSMNSTEEISILCQKINEFLSK
jgi:8-amino-7-oxononanoate synthase